jgi:hypothetical protein
VQRIPVKIVLDDQSLTGLLRPGVSMEPTINTKATVLAEHERHHQLASNPALARRGGLVATIRDGIFKSRRIVLLLFPRLSKPMGSMHLPRQRSEESSLDCRGCFSRQPAGRRSRQAAYGGAR